MQTCRKQRGYLIAVGQIKGTTADEKGRDALENDGQNVQYKRGASCPLEWKPDEMSDHRD